MVGPVGLARGGSKSAAGCKRPSPKLKIKVNLKPDTEVADLLAWYSTLTCTPLMVSSGVTIAGKKVTILSPMPVTVAEIDSLFLGALDSVGLTLMRDGKFQYVIDAAKARHGNTPIVPAR
jgi:type II secretory pathway component GspD/PulD (secretin)